MRCIASSRSRVARLWLLIFPLLFETWAGALPGSAERKAAPQADSEPTTAIVIGFVGGFVRRDRPHHGPIEFAQRIRSAVPKGTHVEVFENRHRAEARATILRLLDTDHDGSLSNQEKNRARIVLYGHSWGATAAVELARDLRREHIPVLLTAQVDSIAIWHDDSIIPDNVAEAVNFYQPYGWLHGRARIAAADPSKTEILGNFRFDYKKNPVLCVGYPWHDRIFTPGHMQSECDPKVWSRLQDLVLESLTTPDSSLRPALKQSPEPASRK